MTAEVNTIKGLVFVLEESPDAFGSISRILEISDFEVVSLTFEHDIAAMVKDRRPDAMIIDNPSIGHQSLDLVAQLKTDRACRDVPLVLVASLFDYDTIMKAVEQGIDEYIIRPLEQNALLLRLGTAQEKKWLRKKDEAYMNILDEERVKADKLLFSILPGAVAERLKEDPGVIAESYSETTVMFADLVGFTQLASKMSPTRVVTFLNDIFSSFDNLADRYGLEKIKTIGDAYMVVGGVPNKREDHAEAIAHMALEMIKAISLFKGPDGAQLRIRIGIHSGPVAAGVIGRKRFIYDLWGDTVNLASRMESQGLPDRIQVSESSFLKLRKKFVFQKRGMLHIKGRGEMVTWLLIGRKEAGDGTSGEFMGSLPGDAARELRLAEEELETLTLVDDATGLYTRRGFLSMVSHLFKLAERERRGMLMLMVNLDNLNDIKRDLGVPMAETALFETGLLFSRTFRTHDISARIGEDRFVVVGMEVTQAREDILETRLSAVIDEFNRVGAQPFKLQVSMASARSDPENPRTLREILAELEKSLWERANPPGDQ